MATAGNIEIACPLCKAPIRIPVALTLQPAIANRRALVTVTAKAVRHRCPS